MTLNRFACAVVFATIVAMAGGNVGRAQDNPVADHAKRVLTLLVQEKFDDVAKEFNAQVAAAMSASQLKDVWAMLRQQVGSFTSVIDQQVTTPAPGITAVVLGTQFEKTALNVILAFDAENKIAGLRFVPRPSSQPSAAPPASSRFKEESVTIGGGEWTLPGTLSMPTGEVTAAVVLVHGSGANDRDETLGPNKPFQDLAWGLANRGVAVLRYEKRNRQYGAKMAGIRNPTVREETTEDALLAAALLRAHDRIDPKRVFVLGHSLGATLAPRMAAEDRSLAGIVIMAGYTRPFVDVVREQLTYLASLNPAVGSPEDGLRNLRQSAPESYWKDLDAYDPAKTAAQLTLPILILQGERDYQVTMADLQGWRAALDGRAHVTIKSYPTLNHLFMPGEGKATPSEYERPSHIPDFVLDDIANWVNKILPPGR